MRRLAKALAPVLVCASGLSGCVIATYGTRPQPVANQADTFLFRVFPSAFALKETFADRAAGEEIGKFRLANGYASGAIVSRDYRDSASIYTVKFAR